MTTTLNLRAQRVALEQLGRTCGAVAALDPRTGKLLVMASSPSYDPNLVENRFGTIGSITADCRPAAPLVNRASQGLYAPGSTFKVVTLAAALESNRYEPDSTFVDPGYCIAYGKRVNNFDTSRPFGNLTLRDGAAVLGQLRVLQHRQGARREADPRPGEDVRLLRAAAARDAGRRAVPERPLPRRRALVPASATRTSTRAGWRSGRSGCS